MDNNKSFFSSDRAHAILLPLIAIFCLALIIGALFAYGMATDTFGIRSDIFKKFNLKIDHPNKIAVIYVEGQMMADRSPDSPGSAFSSDIVKYMRLATEDPSYKAIVLRVNTPGGTPVAAEEIIDQMKKTQTVKPIVISMGDMATSAGYYISSQANRVVANPDTFTGSIGVIWTFENKTKYYQDEGVNFYVAKSGNFKDMGSDKRNLTSGEMNYVQDIINDSYTRFVTNVAKGRNMSIDSVRQIADGRVYTGERAKELGLVDSLGGLYDAVDVAKNLSNVKGKVTIVYMNEPSIK
ncbi:MAG TPA: signal peptide peptidase SppA [Methanocellaceae archaeon]